MKNYKTNIQIFFIWIFKLFFISFFAVLIYSFICKDVKVVNPEIKIDYADGTSEVLNLFENNELKLKSQKGTSWYTENNGKIVKLTSTTIKESCHLVQLYNSKVTFKNDNFTVQVNTKDLDKETIFEHCISRYDIAYNYLLSDMSDAVYNDVSNVYEVKAERDIYDIVEDTTDTTIKEDVVIEFGDEDENPTPAPTPTPDVPDDEPEEEIIKDKISEYTTFASSPNYSMFLNQIPTNYDIGLNSGNVDYTVSDSVSNFSDRIVFNSENYSLVYSYKFDTKLNGRVGVDYSKNKISSSIDLSGSANYVYLNVSLVRKGQNTVKKTLQCSVNTTYKGTIINDDRNLNGMIERNVIFTYKNVKILSYVEYIYPTYMKGSGGLKTVSDIDFTEYGVVRAVTNGLFDSIEGTASASFTTYLSAHIQIEVSVKFKIKSFEYNLSVNN